MHGAPNLLIVEGALCPRPSLLRGRVLTDLADISVLGVCDFALLLRKLIYL